MNTGRTMFRDAAGPQFQRRSTPAADFGSFQTESAYNSSLGATLQAVESFPSSVVVVTTSKHFLLLVFILELILQSFQQPLHFNSYKRRSLHH